LSFPETHDFDPSQNDISQLWCFSDMSDEIKGKAGYATGFVLHNLAIYGYRMDEKDEPLGRFATQEAC
jgi:hypothetical protein